MGLISWIKGKEYRARVHYTAEDVGCVPIDSIQTDDFEEFINFVFAAEREGSFVEWASPRKQREVAEFFVTDDVTQIWGWPR